VLNMKIQENVVIVIKAILPILIVVVLFVIVGQFGFGKISQLQGQISSAQNNQSVLNQKLDILRKVAVTGAQSSNFAVAALPDGNPALLVLSQINILAGTQALALNNLKSGTPSIDSTGLSTAEIAFDVLGSREQIETFLGDIASFAPITVVDRIKLSESAPGVAVANISLKSFWSPFPATIPAVTQAITDLTPDDQQTLQSLGSLTQSVFAQIQPSQAGKSDPFSP